MGDKHALDNHANQLNPNNDLFESDDLKYV